MGLLLAFGLTEDSKVRPPSALRVLAAHSAPPACPQADSSRTALQYATSWNKPRSLAVLAEFKVAPRVGVCARSEGAVATRA